MEEANHKQTFKRTISVNTLEFCAERLLDTHEKTFLLGVWKRFPGEATFDFVTVRGTEVH